MFEIITISFAFFFGLAVRQIGMPPLVGFLAWVGLEPLPTTILRLKV